MVARMPSTYTVKGKVRNDPPHLNALTQRARRFREKAGCLSWEKNAGTANRNNYLLSILPEECKKPRVNSTRSVAQDLDDQQRKVELASVNRGQFQNKRRKYNRTPEAEVNNQSEERKLIPAELSLGIQHSEAANGNQSSPEQRLTIMTTRKRSYASTGNPNAAGQSAPPTTNDSHSNPRKRRIQEASRDHDSEYEVQHLPSAKRQKAAIGADVSDDNGVLERPGVIPARRSSRRITSTARSSYLSVEDEEDTSASESDTEETHISRGRKVQSTGSANQPSLEEGETEIQAPPSKVSGPIVGVLAQYVIEMDSDDEPMYDEQFQTETAATLAKTKDYRFITPIGRATDSRDRAYIRRALELTCIDFCDRRGHAVPNDLLTEHHNESYMSQQRHIQKEFSRIWCGADAAPSLYCLNAWTAGFSQWRVRSGKGQNLMAKLLKGEKMTAKLAKDD